MYKKENYTVKSSENTPLIVSKGTLNGIYNIIFVITSKFFRRGAKNGNSLD